MSLPVTPARRRATRACDQCRKTKSRCDNPGRSNEPCRNCSAAATECTFLQPCHKRGPPKGYLNAIEQRLHDAEALLGAIISSSDSRASTLVSDICKDPLAKSIINAVANSSFGPIGRNAIHRLDSKPNARRNSNELHEQSANEHEAPYLDSNGHLVFTTPSNTWQDYLNLRVSLQVRSRLSNPSPIEIESAQSASTNPLSKCALPSSPVLQKAFSDTDETAMSIDSYDSPASATMAIRSDSSDASELEIAKPHSVRSSISTMSFGDARGDYKTQSIQASYNSLMSSLGLECDLPSFIGSSSKGVFTRSPLDANKFPVEPSESLGSESCPSSPAR